MVSKQLIKDYDFTSMEDYFDYIIESHINGNFTQCLNLYKELSKNQRKDFYNTFNFEENYGKEVNEVLLYISNNIGL